MLGFVVHEFCVCVCARAYLYVSSEALRKTEWRVCRAQRVRALQRFPSVH